MHAKYNGYSFPLRDTVTRENSSFRSRCGIQLCGGLYGRKEIIPFDKIEPFYRPHLGRA